MAEKIRDGKVRCSFCHKSEDQVRKLIAGPEGVFICDECIGICSEIMEEELGDYEQEDIYDTDINLLKPEEIHKILDDYVIGQDEACLLYTSLLDEPTNYLDEEHIAWLKRYLLDYENAFILISHDIPFLNEVVNIIYHMENQELNRYVGDYDHFQEVYAVKKAQLEAAYRRQQQEISELTVSYTHLSSQDTERSSNECRTYFHIPGYLHSA